MANVIYNAFKNSVMGGSYNLTDGSVYVALVNNSYTPDIDTEAYVADAGIIASYSPSGATNYSTAGHALSDPALSTVAGSDYGRFDASDWTLGTATVTARGAVLYSSSGAGYAADPLICYFDFTTDQTATAGDFTIQWNGNGILNIT